ERDHGGVDGFGDLDLVVEDALHEGAVVLHDGALARGEAVTLGPAEAEADGEGAGLGVLVDAAGVAGDVQARDAQRAAGAGDGDDGVEDGGGGLVARVAAVTAGFEADAVHGAVDLGLTDDL